MSKLTKVALALLGLSMSSAFAGVMGSVCSPSGVTVPCESCGWQIGLQALYLQPAYTNYLNLLGGPDASVKGQLKWTWGFEVEGAYTFNTGNDLNLNWYHLNGKKTAVTYTAAVTPLIFPVVTADGIIEASLPASVYRSLTPDWDAVNLEFGQKVNFGDYLIVRMHGGAQYTQINTSVSTSTTQTSLAAFPGITYIGLHESTLRSMRFSGIGPRFGVDTSYGWEGGFSLEGNLAAAVLVGENKSSLTGSYTATGFPVVAVSTSSKKLNIVPELEGKLAIAYSTGLWDGIFSVDLGWLFINYFHPITPSVESSSDFGLQGPYLGIKWLGSGFF